MPETVTKTFQIFKFEELNEKAKERALSWHVENLDACYAEYIIEDAKTIGALMGWRIDAVYWSGFCSQGDGACFVGRMAYKKGCAKEVRKYAPHDIEAQRIAKEWQELQRKNFYSVGAKVTHSGRYYHAYSTSFDGFDNRENHGYLENVETEKQISEIARDFMNWIYKQLESAYEYETSVENFAELCEANDYRFTANGSFYS